MALMMKRMSFLMPRLISVGAPTTNPFLFYLSTLAEKNITHFRSPFADFAATTFNLSSADIARMLKSMPSLDNPKTLQNVERVVHLLTKYGCTQHQIARIMRIQPGILSVSAEKLLEPKIQLLKDLGFEEKDVPTILFKVPPFLSISLQDGLLPKIAFLKSLFQSQNLFLKAVRTNPYVLLYGLEKDLRPSLAFWEGFGFRREELASFLSSTPSLLRNPSLTPPKVDLIRKIGICKENKSFKDVLRMVAPSRMETLESKMDNLRQWGLSAEEIWKIFRISPRILSISLDTLRQKMEFMVSTMELPPNSVVEHPMFLKRSLERVIKPRFVVFQRMKSLHGVEHLKNKQLHTVIAMSEAIFVNRILKGHPELETLYALHKKAIPKV